MSVSAKAGDKRVTDALAGIQKALTEIHRRLGLIDPEGMASRLNAIDTSIATIDTSISTINTSITTINTSITTINTNIAAITVRLDTGDVDFT